MSVFVARESRKRTFDKADENSDDGIDMSLFVSVLLSLTFSQLIRSRRPAPGLARSQRPDGTTVS